MSGDLLSKPAAERLLSLSRLHAHLNRGRNLGTPPSVQDNASGSLPAYWGSSEIPWHEIVSAAGSSGDAIHISCLWATYPGIDCSFQPPCRPPEGPTDGRLQTVRGQWAEPSAGGPRPVGRLAMAGRGRGRRLSIANPAPAPRKPADGSSWRRRPREAPGAEAGG